MANYNPDEQNSLVALVAALRGGLAPSTGYGLFQDILNQQAARVDERQARLSSLTDLLSQQAIAGQSLEGAQALADAYTRGNTVPPRIEDVISSLYPSQMIEGPQEYAPPAMTGSTPSEVGASALAGQPYPGPMPFVEQQAEISPTAPPVDPLVEAQRLADMAQAEQQYAEATAGPEATIGDVVAGINQAIANRVPPEQIRNNAMNNPEAAALITKNYTALSKMFPDIFPSAVGGGI